MDVPVSHRIQTGCFLEDHLRWKFSCAVFRQLINIVNAQNPDGSIVTGKIPSLSWIIRKGLYSENF